MTSAQPDGYDSETCHVTIWQTDRSEEVQLVIRLSDWPQLLGELRARHERGDKSLFGLPPVVQSGEIVKTWCVPARIAAIQVRASGGPEAGKRIGFTEV